MIDNTDEYKWDGLDHLMNSNPNHGPSKPMAGAPKASIFDLNSVRDSVLFDNKDKERFSFCLSPPKDPHGYKSGNKINNNSNNNSKQPIGNHPISSFNNNSKENMSKNTLNQQRIITTSTKHVQSSTIPQQQHQPPQQSKPINISSGGSSGSFVKPLPNIQTSGVSFSKIGASPSKTTLSQQPPSPRMQPITTTTSKKEHLQAMTDVTLEPLYLTNNAAYNSQNNINRPAVLSSRPASPSGILSNPTPSSINNTNNITTTTTVRPMSSRPATPTQMLPTTQSPPLSRRPGTPTKLEPITVVPIVPKATAAPTKDSDSISVVTEAKLESRIKILELDNRILRQQMTEKDKTMDQLNSRINELEDQMKVFMNEVKMVLMNSVQQ
ncbi:hypothetical protein PPL_03025 [Heterostelium album PN500]|uniref:Uncharacterized protein n=1 Tax=Heterostelium pallidum (strain ATCC 26659 / Pp 5 / PN500) TaxID=670386 RepID=D3B3Q7_HETP5|nr:hypothetical protein PPL_03025 [Heterostelium album PN500]EFA83955.1 hypothetical protein PPL_03025 [Heterostelium album PN500]|eukprot:XP_020436072.1 hypothetical protein PPL_03025 [Heterostelium album PN500]